MNVLVSIITPMFNVQDFLSETLESVIAQTYDNWELIAVDDCSMDDTLELARQFASRDARIKVVKAPINGGAAAARNIGTKMAKGSFIAFLDSDDTWEKDKLEKQVKKMQETNAAFSFTAYSIIDESGNFIKTLKTPSYTNYKKLLRGCDIGCLTVVYNAEKLGKHYFLEPTSQDTDSGLPEIVLRKWGREDYVLWLKIAKNCEGEKSMIGLEEPLAFYRKRNGGISSNKKRAAWYQWLVYRRVERLSVAASFINFIFYTLNGFKKHYL